MWSIIFSVCVVALVAADEGEHEYGKYGEWRKTTCEKMNRTLHEDIDACFQTEVKAIKDATKDCVIESAPSSSGNLVDFEELACVDKSLFKKFDKCMDEYEADPEFRKQMEITNETIACYEALLEIYNMVELKPALDEEIASVKAMAAAE
ncbi:hypothetical protein JTE90_012006 [Oedothorax gibbosus]|uniref:Secreted protein n=1 Tax=Oedothorax gibbosus TaxID=931172 RepID=A0AAV6UQ51_9ARAC|nr:hypothetical protein JTE90_012006 [Oedothorax gibbosus]